MQQLPADGGQFAGHLFAFFFFFGETVFLCGTLAVLDIVFVDQSVLELRESQASASQGSLFSMGPIRGSLLPDTLVESKVSDDRLSHMKNS